MAYLGSPLWHYGLLLYAESFLAALAVGAYAAALRAERTGLAGWLLAAGVLIKPPFILIAAPLIADAVLRRKPVQVQQYALPIAMAVLLASSWNRFMYGGWLRNAQEWESGSLTDGLCGLTFSWRSGLLLFSPALLLSAIALPAWFRRCPRDAILMTSVSLLYGGLMAYWYQWWGGMCYSARLIIPIVPFLFAPLPLLFHTSVWKTHGFLRAAGIVLMVVSVAFGAIGAFGCDYVLFHHPLQLLWMIARARAATMWISRYIPDAERLSGKPFSAPVGGVIAVAWGVSPRISWGRETIPVIPRPPPQVRAAPGLGAAGVV